MLLFFLVQNSGRKEDLVERKICFGFGIKQCNISFFLFGVCGGEWKQEIWWLQIGFIHPDLRFAERIFWGIEACRSEDEESRQLALKNATTPRTIELYMFLQAFLHSLPQILFQMYLLMRHSHTTDKQTGWYNFKLIISRYTLFSHRFKRNSFEQFRQEIRYCMSNKFLQLIPSSWV